MFEICLKKCLAQAILSLFLGTKAMEEGDLILLHVGRQNRKTKVNYIVLDLEWNQTLSPKLMIRDTFNLSGEIIQFGAVKIDNVSRA